MTTTGMFTTGRTSFSVTIAEPMPPSSIRTPSTKKDTLYFSA